MENVTMHEHIFSVVSTGPDGNLTRTCDCGHEENIDAPKPGYETAAGDVTTAEAVEPVKIVTETPKRRGKASK